MLNEDRILEVLREQKVSAASLEEGASLVDFWIRETAPFDSLSTTLAVEAGFYIELSPNTFIVGTLDRVAQSRESGEVFGCEWKTTKGKTKFWSPSIWLQSISASHQLSTYALGLQRGEFIDPLPFPTDVFPLDGSINILVRAISKSTPPELWPSEEGKFVTLTKERMETTLNSYSNVAAAIRGMRGTGVGPWQLPGLQCTNVFRKVCPFLEGCKKFESFSTSSTLMDMKRGFSPGSSKVIQHLMEVGKVNEGNEGDVVILSASSLSSFQQCGERWRREAGSSGEEESEALEVGTVLHSGLGEFYSQLKD